MNAAKKKRGIVQSVAWRPRTPFITSGVRALEKRRARRGRAVRTGAVRRHRRGILRRHAGLACKTVQKKRRGGLRIKIQKDENPSDES